MVDVDQCQFPTKQLQKIHRHLRQNSRLSQLSFVSFLRHSGHLGKRLGLYAENEEEVVNALVDAHGGKKAEEKYTRSREKKGV